MDYVDLGRRIRQLRQASRMTQAALAEMAEVSASFLGNIERGNRVVSLETLVKLCRALDTDPNYLLAASVEAAKGRIPIDMPEKMRKQLAMLFDLGYRMLQAENEPNG